MELPTDVQTPIHKRSLRHSFHGWFTGYAVGWLMDHEKRDAEAFVGLVGFMPPRQSGIVCGDCYVQARHRNRTGWASSEQECNRQRSIRRTFQCLLGVGETIKQRIRLEERNAALLGAALGVLRIGWYYVECNFIMGCSALSLDTPAGRWGYIFICCH